jgi:hypothetical protein
MNKIQDSEVFLVSKLVPANGAPQGELLSVLWMLDLERAALLAPALRQLVPLVA